MTAPIGKEVLGSVLGKVPSGVFILTVDNQGTPSGMMASWVQQAGFEPPTLMMAMQSDREFFQQLQETGRLTVNILSPDDKHLMKAFGRYNPEAFNDLAYFNSYCGVVLTDALGSLDVVVKATLPASDHTVVIGEVVGGYQHHTGKTPMTHVRSSGFSY